MKLNLEEMREIARILPIGYYLGRKVPVFVEEGNRAYCDIVKGDVHIGVGLLQLAADHIDATDAAEWDRETLMRCLLYHEIGHLLLTPGWNYDCNVRRPNGTAFPYNESCKIVNIFEDERLERILERYFMGVKFRKFVKLVHKGVDTGKGKTCVSKIYRAIRLRDAPPDVSAAVDDAVKELAEISAATPYRWYDSVLGWREYRKQYFNVLNALIEKILGKPPTQEEPSNSGEQQQSQQQSQSQEQGQSEQEQSESGKPEKSAPQEQSDDGKPDGGKPDGEPEAEEVPEAEENSGGEGDGDDGSDGKSDKPDEEDSEGDEGSGDADGDADGDDAEEPDGDDAEQPDKDADGGDDADGGVDGDDGEEETSDGDATGDDADGGAEQDASATEDEDAEDCDGEATCTKLGGVLPPDYLRGVADKVFATPTSDIENVLRRFAQRIAKQRGAQAAGRWSALTGRIDPRRDAMDKDRIFRRASDVGDAINTAVHLTLWVDVSGSFKKSEPLLNQILAATYRAMKMSGGKLDVDVVKMCEDAEVASPNNWQIVALGCNSINDTYSVAWRKTRKKNRRNIDVVVFDGGACYLPKGAKYRRYREGIFKIVRQIWDSPDCHLVIDKENEVWAQELKRAHVTLLASDYAERLQGEVIKLLDRIL